MWAERDGHDGADDTAAVVGDVRPGTPFEARGARAPERIVYFGYGSLVNRATRPVEEGFAPARLRGWRRAWNHRISPRTDRGASCSLTVEPDAGAVDGGIDGVVVSLPLEALPALDAREGGYDRLTLPAGHFDLPEGLGVDEVHVYRSKVENRLPATDAQPILQSYVDCVLAGYLRVYGEGGLDAFMHSTHGWEGPIENDRVAPRYVRAVEVPGALLTRFDRLIAARRGR